jgi:hypothetical protein
LPEREVDAGKPYRDLSGRWRRLGVVVVHVRSPFRTHIW